jgi:hypothetical protein
MRIFMAFSPLLWTKPQCLNALLRLMFQGNTRSFRGLNQCRQPRLATLSAVAISTDPAERRPAAGPTASPGFSLRSPGTRLHRGSLGELSPTSPRGASVANATTPQLSILWPRCHEAP